MNDCSCIWVKRTTKRYVCEERRYRSSFRTEKFVILSVGNTELVPQNRGRPGLPKLASVFPTPIDRCRHPASMYVLRLCGTPQRYVIAVSRCRLQTHTRCMQRQQQKKPLRFREQRFCSLHLFNERYDYTRGARISSIHLISGLAVRLGQ